MRFGNVFEPIRPIRFESGSTAPSIKPVGQVCFVEMREKELLLVVSVEEGGVVFIFNTNKEIDDPFGIGTAIDVVANEN